MNKKIKIIIADDHKIFRKGLHTILSVTEKFDIIAEAENGAQLLKMLEQQLPDVILLDIKMPELDGIEALKIIKDKYPEIKVIMLTMYDDDAYIMNLMEQGANAFLIKNTDAEEIRNAIIATVESGYYFNDKTSKALLKKIATRGEFKQKLNNKIELNERESTTLKLICEEYSTAEIASQMFLSPRTIDGIRSTLLEKTGAKNTAGLVLFAVRNGYFC